MSWKRPDVYSRMSVFLEKLPDHISPLCLDIGTGDGIFADLMKDIQPNSGVYQSDIKLQFIKTNRFILHSASHPPFRSKSFDIIILGQVLHYIPSNQQIILLKKLIETISNKGVILVIEYETNKSYSWIPYPVSSNRITKFELPKVKTEIVYDKDKRRPKYAYYLFRSK